MNKDDAKEYLPLVQALVEGKTIQFKSYLGGEWSDASTPTFTEPASKYRIKPEPIELELWYHEKAGTTCYVRTEDRDDCWAGAGFRKIKVKEVL